MESEQVLRIDAVLPQTQCTRCGYVDCRAYAEAIVAGTTDINRCPPGGEATLVALSVLTGRPARALDPACGSTGPLWLAVIDEARCIGCTLCIQACPVDAILGGPKRMHTALASLCSGCELCIAPCPVDCITLQPAGREWTHADAAAASLRHASRRARLAHAVPVARRARSALASASTAAQRRAAVAMALARARARRSKAPGNGAQ